MEQYLHTPCLNTGTTSKKNIKCSEIDCYIKLVSCLVASQQGNMPFGEFEFHLFWIKLGVPYQVVHTK
jgi:hypothetical protein